MSNHDFVPMFLVSRPQSIPSIALPFLALQCLVVGHRYIHGQTVGKGKDGRMYWLGHCERCWRGGYLKGNLQELYPYQIVSGRPESREPEKLNNAQNEARYSTENMLLPCAKCGERRAHVNHYAEYGGDHPWRWRSPP